LLRVPAGKGGVRRINGTPGNAGARSPLLKTA
jgi:hypothetical protein